MPLSWNEIKSRAVKFSKDWEDATEESAESQTFINKFFEIFGISRRRVSTFEKPIKKLDGSENRKYIPIGYFNKDYIVADSCNSIPKASKYHFGVLTSEMYSLGKASLRKIGKQIKIFK